MIYISYPNILFAIVKIMLCCHSDTIVTFLEALLWLLINFIRFLLACLKALFRYIVTAFSVYAFDLEIKS